ncbi:restriction endonuclease subunit S, partial [Avibacterium avium]
MSEWKLKKLGDLGIIKTGKTPSSKILGAFDLSGIPFITPKDMHNKKIVDNTERYLSPNGFEAVKNCVIPKNSVCVSCIGTVGLVVLTKESSITNQQINSLIVDENINNPDFLYYLLSSIKETIKLLASSGSVVPILNKTDFSKIQVKIPNKKTQDTISSYLKCLDDKITLNTQTNQTLEQIAQGIFKHWFIDFAPVHAKANALARGETTEQAELAAMACLSGKTMEKITALKTQDPTAYHQLQQTAAAFPSEFVETEMGKVPRGWEVKQVKDMGKIICGKTPSKKKEEFYGNDIPFIKIPDMHNNTFIIKTTDNLTLLGANNQKTKFIEKGSICISCIATVGLVSITSERSQTNQQINSIVPNSEIFTEYLYLYFSQDTMNKKLKDLASGGSATLNLNTTAFSNIT